MARVSDKVWNRYNKIIDDFFNDDIGKQPFTWLKYSEVPGLYGEDNNNVYYPIKLQGLFHYNHVRAWPYNITTTSGTLDKTNVVLYITKTYLESLGHLDSHGYWDFDTTQDRFIVDGKVYRPSGDTPVAQVKDHAALFFLVLEIDNESPSRDLVNKYT